MAASRGDHARCPEGTLIGNRYKVLRECGCGNFSKVFRCVDTKAPTGSAPVAVKLLKREYAQDATFENDMLKGIMAKDPSDKYKLLKTIDYFVWNRHPCFVFPLKGPALRSRKLGVARGHVDRNELRAFAKQMCTSLSYLHESIKMVHTDLKPENILLDEDVATGLGKNWTVVDFGSASYWKTSRLDSDLISTRPYRSPEVVMGEGWYHPADTWSLACILFEVYSGSRLFEVHDDATHIQHFIARLGKMPDHLTRCAKNSRKFFDMQGNPIAGGRSSSLYPSRSSSSSSMSHVKSIDEVLKADPEFLDLIKSMLHFDPNRRMTCAQALKHPFFEGTSSSASKLAPVAEEKQKLFTPAPAALNVLAERSKSTTNVVAAMEKLNLNGMSSAAAAAAPASARVPVSAASKVAAPRVQAPMSSRAYQLPPAGVPSARIGTRPW